MHYYQHNIGDFMCDTAHLTPLEECFYRRALDFYYLNEKPLPKETQSVFRRLRAITQEDKEAVLNILEDFFTEEDDGYHNKRCDAEILAYQQNANKNRENGKKGGRPPKNKANSSEVVNLNNPQETHSVNLGFENQTQNNLNHKPLTNNHKPLTNIKNTHTSESEKNSLDEIVNLWNPNLDDVNSWLQRSGELAMTQELFEQIKPVFLSYYAGQIQTGVLPESKLFGKLVAWIKRDYRKPNSTEKPKFNDRDVNSRWPEIQHEPATAEGLDLEGMI